MNFCSPFFFVMIRFFFRCPSPASEPFSPRPQVSSPQNPPTPPSLLLKIHRTHIRTHTHTHSLSLPLSPIPSVVIVVEFTRLSSDNHDFLRSFPGSQGGLLFFPRYQLTSHDLLPWQQLIEASLRDSDPEVQNIMVSDLAIISLPLLILII